MKEKNGSEIFWGENYFIIMMAEPVVENVGDGHDKRVENELQEPNKGGQFISNGYFVLSCAVSLR